VTISALIEAEPAEHPTVTVVFSDNDCPYKDILVKVKELPRPPK